MLGGFASTVSALESTPIEVMIIKGLQPHKTFQIGLANPAARNATTSSGNGTLRGELANQPPSETLSPCALRAILVRQQVSSRTISTQTQMLLRRSAAAQQITGLRVRSMVRKAGESQGVA